jgi:branched-chain amino acid transport system substrate-binding protein
MVTADDYCDGEQAVAAAKKLIEAKVVAVLGHECSGAAIPASEIYAEAGMLMISTFATNPKLTEQGFTNVFRMVGRDDVQSEIAAELLAERWGSQPIAILHDGKPYGKGLAEGTKKRLNERGIAETIFEAIEPGRAEYSDVVRKMQEMGVDVIFFGGYVQEIGLLARQAHDLGYDWQIITGDAVGTEDFALIAGAASDGTLFIYPPNPRMKPEAAQLAKRFTRSPGEEGTFIAYAAVQVWIQAVEKAGTVETGAVAAAMRANEFDTVLGRIGFDDKGDVTGYDTFVWYQWQGGDYAPVEPGKPTD